VAVVGGLAGFFLAGYTGVLLSVTNRPVWADSTWLGLLFLLSAASTAAATLILLARRRSLADDLTVESLARFDKWVLVLELVVLVIFLISLGSAIRAFMNAWGVVLLLFVVGAGILLPLAVGFGRVTRWREWTFTPGTAAGLVLFGGLMLRIVTLLASEQVWVAGHRVVGQ
jgi:formate-dependent nitrite reductase membrane component NrfD